MISTPDRVKAVELIDEAVSSGARRAIACNELGICDRTYRRWTNGDQVQSDQRPHAEREPPPNKLSAQERQAVLDACHQEEHSSLPPGQIVPRLADEGKYIASEATFYRILHEEQEQHHRARSKKPTAQRKPTSHCATGSNQVWSWDVSYLPSDIRGEFYYLYMIMDIFSRKITGWEVHECELGEYAATLVHKAVMNELCAGKPLVLHADNGSIQKGSTLRAKLEFLGVSTSFSRPRVSNDNPYSESLFRTCKYSPEYPQDGFASLEDARRWMSRFVHWYNHEHRHSGIKHVTPAQRHNGVDKELLKKRVAVYENAKTNNPHRWSGNTRNWQWQDEVWLNPENQGSDPKQQKKAA